MSRFYKWWWMVWKIERGQRRTGNTGREAWGSLFLSSLIWHKYCQRNYETRGLRSAARFIFAIDDINNASRFRFWRICSAHSFFLVPIINCLQNMIDVLVPETGGLFAREKKKKKKRHSRSVCDRRRRAHNEYRGFLFITFISDSLIIRILFTQSYDAIKRVSMWNNYIPIDCGFNL